MKKKLALLIVLLCAGLSAGAQKFIDDLTQQHAGEGRVTVSQSEEISDLVNGTVADAANTTTAGTTTATTPSSSTAESHSAERVEHREATASTTAETAIDTRKKVMRNSYKTDGYRVQVFSGGSTRADRTKAEQTRNAMKVAFPTQPIYTHFYSPRWVCRMGNFKTYAEAEKVLKQVKAMGYPQACIVKGKISVQY